MKKTLSKIWEGWKKFGIIVGNIMSTIFLFIFYYTLFALFAIPFRIFAKPLGVKHKNSNFVLKPKICQSLENFKREF